MPAEFAGAVALQSVLRVLQEVDPASALFKRSRELLQGSLEVEAPILKPTARRERKFLTIGMVTRRDYDGFYFTVQAMRLYHPEILSDVEFLVVDNDPAGPCAKPVKNLENWCKNYRYIPYRTTQGTAVRELVFREATGEFVLCIDSHVLFAPGSLARLMEYCRSHPDSNDLLHGTLLSDAIVPMGTHLEPKWSEGRYGCWALDERGKDADSPPFEIGMHGLGVFACRREAWPGLNPRLSGFGGQEGYVHEKIRRAGGRSLCLPFLRWMRRPARPLADPHPIVWEDRIRNWLLIQDELGLDPTPAISHWEEFLGPEGVRPVVQATEAELEGPFHFFDGIYCINLDRQPERWEAMQQRFRELGIERGIRRFSAADTPLNHHIGRVLSHRRIVAEAKLQQLQTILVFEDNGSLSPETTGELTRGLRELQEDGNEWQVSYLDGSAIAYHHSSYDAILKAVPDDAVYVARLVKELDEPGETMQQLFRFFALRSGEVS